MRFCISPNWAGPRTPRRRAAAAGAALLAGATLVTVVASRASAAGSCAVDYSVNQWNTGFTAQLTLTNLGEPVSNWKLEFDYLDDQQITQSWNSSYRQVGHHVTLTNAAWNGNLDTNDKAALGFNAGYSGANTAPTAFSFNGVACTGSPPGPTGSPTPPTSPSPSPSPTPGDPGPPPGPGQHVANPFAGAKGYVNPEWSAKAGKEPGGSAIANQPTAVWLDRIAAIHGTPDSSSNGAMGLTDHLDAALGQAGGQPLYAQFVVYDLPNRDCSALASNGELKIAQDGLNKYKTQYIDPIAAVMSDPKYAPIRIVTIIEPDSLPNLITNLSFPACAEAKQTNAYVAGVQYALDTLHAIPNVYTYVDAAHHAWLGWDSNFTPTVGLFAATAQGTRAGFASIDGFIVNTANYAATQEPYFQAGTTVGGQSVRQSKWVDWNQYVDERSYAAALKSALIGAGFPATIGMLVDTSRNGWGGSARPSGPSSSTDPNTFVDQSRTDRRIHAGNWCNQSGAGLGARPQVTPGGPWAAYVWIKPPGESDGSSTQIPNNEGKGFDRMCDPTYGGNSLNGNNPTGALPAAPISGAWFSAQFQELVRNAYPPLS